MLKLMNYVAILLAVLLGIGVLNLKFTVKEKRSQVEALAQKIRSDRENIRVLQAEWALLSSPTLLQERSYRFLALMPLSSRQILADANAIPMRRKGTDADTDQGVLLPTAAKDKEPRVKSVNNKGNGA